MNTQATAPVDQTDIDITLETAKEIEDGGEPTLANCIRACARAAQAALGNSHKTVDPDAERFRWLQAAVDRNERFSVYEYGAKVFELRTAIDIARGMTAARDGNTHETGEQLVCRKCGSSDVMPWPTTLTSAPT